MKRGFIPTPQRAFLQTSGSDARLVWGFTLIEVLIVIGVLAVLGTVGFLSLSGAKRNMALEKASQSMAAFLREAQQRAISQESGSDWCVHLDKGLRDSYKLHGGSCSGTPLESAALPSMIEMESAVDSITFAKASGLPVISSEIVLKLSNDPSVYKTILVNAQGTIEVK